MSVNIVPTSFRWGDRFLNKHCLGGISLCLVEDHNENLGENFARGESLSKYVYFTDTDVFFSKIKNDKFGIPATTVDHTALTESFNETFGETI